MEDWFPNVILCCVLLFNLTTSSQYLLEMPFKQSWSIPLNAVKIKPQITLTLLTLSRCFLCLQVLSPCIFLNYTYPACFLLHILSAPVPKFLLFPFHFTICTITQLFPALIQVFFQTWPPHFLLIHFWLLFISLKVFLSLFNPSTPTHS